MSHALGFVNVIDPTSNQIIEIRYDKFVGKLLKKLAGQKEDLIHAVLGVAGEAGEMVDAIKKHAIYGKELDVKNVIEELGDMRFYLQALQNLLNISEQSVLQANANKLAERYKKLEYSDKAAIERADKVGKIGE